MNSNLFILSIASVVGGYVVFLIIYRLLPKRLTADTASQRQEILQAGRETAKQIYDQELEIHTETHQGFREEIESELNERQEDLKLSHEELDSRHSSLQKEEARIVKAEADQGGLRAKAAARLKEFEQAELAVKACQSDLVAALEKKSGESKDRLLKSLCETEVDDRHIQAQKTMKFLEDELESASKKLAQRMMARGLARYAPTFVWPKPLNFIELKDPRLPDRISESQVLQDLKEVSGVEIELLADQPNQVPVVKFAGGAGINKEAAKLCFDEMITKGAHNFHKSNSFYEKHRNNLERIAINLGSRAMKEVGIKGVHLEIQKLVGYLNWRTSYRQNQWYHTVEVAKLAGILATELGVDVDEAKRCGMLHDIGKALDYQIDGSHAVISADYADRFGENKVICDTVMSHHNDLIVETPLSFVLRAADTLSGARPGARVNLEEGYQMRLSGINDAVRSFPGIISVSIMNGAREVHVEVNHKRVNEADLEKLSQKIARKIEEDVAFPGEIKVLVSRRFEITAVA